MLAFGWGSAPWAGGLLIAPPVSPLLLSLLRSAASIVLYSGPGCFYWSLGVVCSWWSLSRWCALVCTDGPACFWCCAVVLGPALMWVGWCGQWSWAPVLGFFNTWPFKVFSAATSQTMFDFTDESFLLWSWWCCGRVALLSSRLLVEREQPELSGAVSRDQRVRIQDPSLSPWSNLRTKQDFSFMQLLILIEMSCCLFPYG